MAPQPLILLRVLLLVLMHLDRAPVDRRRSSEKEVDDDIDSAELPDERGPFLASLASELRIDGTILATPEPSTALLVAAGLLLLGSRRRRSGRGATRSDTSSLANAGSADRETSI